MSNAHKISQFASFFSADFFAFLAFLPALRARQHQNQTVRFPVEEKTRACSMIFWSSKAKTAAQFKWREFTRKDVSINSA